MIAEILTALGMSVVEQVPPPVTDPIAIECKKIEERLNEKFKEDTPQTFSGTDIEPNPKN
jgi:hypothetical protein